MNHLQELNFTQDDIDMLVEGLEHLPNKDATSHLLDAMIDSLVSKQMHPDEKNKLLQERKDKEAKRERENKELEENIKILQAKLIMLKRLIQQQENSKAEGSHETAVQA